MITKGQCPECQATAGELHKPGCSLGKPLFSNDATKSSRFGPGAGQSNVPKEIRKRGADSTHNELEYQAGQQAAFGLSIVIREIDHANQRYDTCGDWFWRDGALVVRASHLPDRREMFLIAIHELIEAFLCECAGVMEASVDQFDHGHAQMALRGEEPGDCITAPYYKQHQITTGIERILAAEVGVSWLNYEKHIEELSQ
jgi:hypothetical protein